MSLTDIRSAYRDVFQTLRRVGEREERTSETGFGPSVFSEAQKQTDKPSVEVSLSVQAQEKAEDTEINDVDPRVEVLSREKGRARARLIELGKQLKLVRKIWQFQPKELAKQLVRLAKELKEVLDDYKKVQKELAEILGSASGGGAMGMPAIPSVPPAAPAATADEPASEQDMQDEADRAVEAAEAEFANDVEKAEFEAGPDDVPSEDSVEAEDAANEAPPEEGLSSYGQVKFERYRLDQTPAAMELRNDLEFVGFVKGLHKKLKEAFGDVKRLAPGLNQDSKDDRKLYELTGKVLKKLEKEIIEYEADLHKAMPPAIWVTKAIAPTI